MKRAEAIERLAEYLVLRCSCIDPATESCYLNPMANDVLDFCEKELGMLPPDKLRDDMLTLGISVGNVHVCEWDQE